LQYETAIREVSILNRIAPFAIREHCGPQLASLLRYVLMYDKRDNPIFPTKGIMCKSINEYSGLGGNVHYLSHTTHAEFNQRLPFGLVAQVGARFGILKDIEKRRLPISNLFYCGGPLTLRGFEYGGAGPFEEGTPIGAKVSLPTISHNLF